jgi:hypothetical protein
MANAVLGFAYPNTCLAESLLPAWTNSAQIVQMSSFFGIKGMELKKVKVMAARAKEMRSKAPAGQTDSLTINKS